MSLSVFSPKKIRIKKGKGKRKVKESFKYINENSKPGGY